MRSPLLLALLFLYTACDSAEHEVVLYTSQDQFYAEPILQEFTRETGIRVRTVFDTESAKTAGLANRLRHEAPHPRCEVFWSNEEMHTRLLARDGVVDESAIRTVGYRTRRLVLNTNLLSSAQLPSSLLELTNEYWRGKVALAYPLYGTTSSHFLALRQQWGAERWLQWCRALARNNTKVLDGNSVVVKLVGAGEAWIGLTDSDDIAAGLRSGLPVTAAPVTPEMLVIPNTIVPVAPLTDHGRRLMDFLSRPETAARLAALGALEGADPGAITNKIHRIDWRTAASEVNSVMETLREIFLRS